VTTIWTLRENASMIAVLLILEFLKSSSWETSWVLGWRLPLS